ncbi:MAG: serine hydrolase domain-containing protein [Actinomycetota bacterium]
MSEVTSDVARRLSARAAASVAEQRLTGASAGVVLNDRLAWSGGYGFVETASDRAPDEDTLYRIASITKTFTATAIMQLRDEGKLDLDDPLVQHIPEFASARDPFGPIEHVTIRRLLTHESGLMTDSPGMRPESFFYPSTEEVLAAADHITIAIPPDSADKYSNLAFQLLGEVVARIGGRSYPDHVRARVTEPLEMKSTTFDPGHDLGERVARGYDARWFTDELRPAAILPPTGIESDGGLYSTVADLARWIVFQFTAADDDTGHQVLRASSLREMFRPRTITRDDWTEAQGVAWYSTRRDETILLGHDGSLNGFDTSIRFNVAARIGAIVLLNGIGDASELAFGLVEEMLGRSSGHPDAEPRAQREATPERWRELLGLYVMEDFGQEARVEWRDGRLMISTGDDFRRLEPTDNDLTFMVRGGRWSGEQLVFERGEQGRIEVARMAAEPFVKMIPARDLREGGRA